MADDGITELIAGPHAVAAALQTHPDTVDCVWVAKERSDERVHGIMALARAAHVLVRQSPRTALDRMAPGLAHQGVLARRRRVERPREEDLVAHLARLTQPLVLVLDQVQDPHNLGACLRSAEAAGVHLVIVPRHARAPLSAITARAACGAAERLPLYEVANLARTLRTLKDAGLWIVGAAADAPASLHDCAPPTPTAWVLGGEGSGLRRLTREACDVLVHIPMLGHIESLNVSVATGLCLYESVRARAAAAVGSSEIALPSISH
ncbi:23S rRNA (guanosine(2251)-2'-O)-methyltransferase RlmB [Acidiferrobacter sp.]|uniref:23S rRNA (guanosine(2251)-2'-O)-methyltransferase RlmB n=1 Tax=Acidiferrobacter sp. TaxID=1872107 RepID=UPI00262EC60C|nr:23S rRNA (guanosine(2251)-2'-O)-methyltransferase RlmB [Acidiferrobacter sp.]